MNLKIISKTNRKHPCLQTFLTVEIKGENHYSQIV